MSNVADELPAVGRARPGVASPWLSVLAFATTTLVSAFLLFQVQPLLSKFILPWFGGSPTVWTTAMLFFQVALFAGYGYAHCLIRCLRPRTQSIVHGMLLAAALCALPIAPDIAWKPVDSSAPTWQILGLLAACVGLPYLALAATGPLIQAWFSRVCPGTSPYRLYALSNFGSLVALVSYPFFFEPAFDTSTQAWAWSLGFGLFVVLCGICALRAATAPVLEPTDDAVAGRVDAEPGWREWATWLALPAVASTALLATTNHVCQDVAVIPFLWVVPLALYLVTFIIAFDHPRWYVRRPLAALAALSLLLVGTQNFWNWDLDFSQELVMYFAALFLLCLVCHGELVRHKPDARHLTAFYLMIAAGGALGGIFVSLLAPHIFSDYLEWPLILVVGLLLTLGIFFLGSASAIRSRPRLLLGAVTALVAVSLVLYDQRDSMTPIAMARNFYGVASVYERHPQDPSAHEITLYNGSVIHGTQFVLPAKHLLPTTYYSPASGVGRALTALGERSSALRVGAVGLGIGTLSAYCRPGDNFTFYEINPEIERLARKYFSYLSSAPGKVGVVLGDARISLERQELAKLDLLVLDAFSGDAIPAHLLTAEAFEIYLRHLDAARGTVAIHISNRYLDLAPVVVGLADKYGFRTVRIVIARDEEHRPTDDRVKPATPGVENRRQAVGEFPSDWVILSRDGELIDELQKSAGVQPLGERHILWTDARSNLFEILK